MTEFDVVWTEPAVQDLEDIGRHVALDSASAARRLMKRLRERAESLWSMPQRGRVVPEFRALGLMTWREIIEPPHRIIYRFQDQQIVIEVIFDGRRDAEAVLTDRLLRC